MTADMYDAIIVGGGVSGMISAIRLQADLGLNNVLIIERATKFGGTWQWNQYPGCGCDVPTKLYSFSFEQRKDWSTFFSPQAEIHKYLNEVGEKYQLSKKTLFQHEAKKATFDKDNGTWQVEVQSLTNDAEGGLPALQLCKSRILISGMGAISVPREIGIKGAEKFKGPLFHSARWDHSVDLTGKKVVVLGNGCSASQIIPHIAPKVKQLTQVVRSKHWISPRFSDPFAPFKALEVIPGFTLIERFGVTMFLESHFLQADRKWGKGARKRYSKVCTKYIQDCAPKKYHDMLIPTEKEVQVACKRRIFDDGYIPSLCRKNVELTNDQVVEIKEHSVILQSGREIACDVLVHANGFNSENNSLQMDIIGPSGSLIDYWKHTVVPQAYRGTMISGFPNFFIMWGPNTATGHFSAIWTIEAQVDLMISALRPCLAKSSSKSATVQVAKKAEDKEQEYIQYKMKDKIYTTGCGAWYTDEDTGKVTALAPCTQTIWQRRCRYPVMSDFEYEGVDKSKSAASHLSMKKQIGIALNRGGLPDYANQTPLLKPFRAFGHGVAMTAYQGASWTFDNVFGLDKPEPFNRKQS